MKKAVLPIAVVLITSLGFSSSAGAAATSADSNRIGPLRVKVAPLAGKKVKVAKKLKLVMSCSKDCIVKVKFKLITPGLTDSVKGGKALKANAPFITGMVLNSFGVRLLKNNYRQSRFKAIIQAQDVSNGRVVRKTKTFKFKRS